MHVLAAALYIAMSAKLWHTRWSGSNLQIAPSGLTASERLLLLSALLAHGTALFNDTFADDVMHFGFAIALSFMFWLAVTMYWVESFYARVEGLLLIALPMTAIADLLSLLIPEHRVLANAGSTVFRLHFLVAMLSYSLFTLAALHAALMSALEKKLHRGRLPPLLSGLPPLLTMEALLFRLIHIAFLLLTLTLVSGVTFSEELFGKALVSVNNAVWVSEHHVGTELLHLHVVNSTPIVHPIEDECTAFGLSRWWNEEWQVVSVDTGIWHRVNLLGWCVKN